MLIKMKTRIRNELNKNEKYQPEVLDYNARVRVMKNQGRGQSECDKLSDWYFAGGFSIWGAFFSVAFASLCK